MMRIKDGIIAQALKAGSNRSCLLLLFCAFAISNLVFADYFPRQASAGSYRHHSGNHVKPFDHIILTWADNPATNQAVSWRSHNNAPEAVAEIAPALASSDFVKTARQIKATTSSLEIPNKLVYYHSVNFTELDPDTLYAYRVGNGDLWSEWFQFKTAVGGNQPFSFLYFGDAQNYISSLWSRTIRAAVLYTPGARFMIHSGDLVHNKDNAGEWDEWFDAGGWLFASIPSLPVVGNHEYKKKWGQRRTLSRFWRPQFRLPENEISGLEETYYQIDYQGVRFVILNSNKHIKQQAGWLEGVLRSNPNLWTIVAFHHPVYSSVRGRDNKAVRKHWQPLLEKFKVDLVLQGHDHVYSRGHGRGMETGPVYVTSVSGPKMYKLARTEWMDQAGGNMQLFQVISISGEVLNYKSITVTGEIYDAFDLVKQKDNTSRLINKVPTEKIGSAIR